MSDIRTISASDLRAKDQNKVVGYAAKFNSLSENLGNFKEKIAPGAFDGVLDNADVRLLVDHDPSKILARTTAGTLRLSVDRIGLKIEATLPDTQVARDLKESIKRGDVNQMSFAFQIGKKSWEGKGDNQVRIIEKIDRLFDVSIVTFPAYPDTSVSLRNRNNRSYKLNSKQNKLASLWSEVSEICGEAEHAGRDLNKTERSLAHRICDELDAMVDCKTGGEVSERMERLDELLRRSDSEPVRPYTADHTREHSNGGPFKTMGEQMQSIMRAGIPGQSTDPRLFEIRGATGLNESVPSDGGFLVQGQFSTDLLNRTFEQGDILSRCNQIPLTGNSIKLPYVDEQSRADGSRMGGIRGYWQNEADAMTASKPKFGTCELNLKKVTALVYCTEELLQDAAALEAWLLRNVPKELRFKAQDAVIRGTGAGQPLGILNAGCVVEVAKESGQAGSTVIAENIEKMYSRLPGENKKNAIWMVHSTVWPQLFQLSHAVGTGGVPVFVPPSGVSGAPFGTLLGRPILEIEQCEAVGTKGDILFCDLGEYLLASKPIRSESSIHVRFIHDEQVFRFVWRLDGQPGWATSVSPYKGSDSISPFIALASR
jgi:HK97 family phage major capsid protein/HK97 family phage prohead protease